MNRSQGHAEAARERLAGRNPYVPTAPVLGGLRAPQQQLPTKICVMVGNHRPVKLLPIYQRYSTTSSALSPVPGFIISPLNGFVDADITVVENLSDIDTARSEHLATHPNQKQKECFLCSVQVLVLAASGSGIALVLWAWKGFGFQKGCGGFHAVCHPAN